MLDEATAAFIQTGVSISLASAGPDRRVTMSRGYGCRVLDGGARVAVFVRRSQSTQLIDNVRRGGLVANVFSRPSDNLTVQLKGRDARVCAFEAPDEGVVASHIDAFVEQVVPLGTPEAVVRALFARAPLDMAAVVYVPFAVFSQTPGPRAGERIAGAA